MKRKLLILSVALLAFGGTAFAAKPAITVFVNGKQVKTPVAPVNSNGTVLVPLRSVAEAVGGTATWDSVNQRVNISTPPAASQGLTLEQLNKIGESVALVQQFDAGGNLIGTGSAFVVNGYAVTNYHVADGAAVSLKLDFGQTQITVQVKDAAFVNKDADLIGFKVSGVQGLSLDITDQKQGGKIYVLGYPHHRFTITEGEYGFIRDNRLVHNAGQESGASGGAVINQEGKVVGIAVAAYDGTKTSLAVPASVLQSELGKL